MNSKKIIIGITGASGAIYGVRFIEALKELQIETHLVITDSAELTLNHETNTSKEHLVKLVKHCYDNKDFSASIASGSFKNDGMIIAPCSMKTMAQIATGNIDSLIARAADVALKERRKLIVMTRESPLHLGHLRNMVSLTEMGAIIAPPMPALYILPKTIDDLINHTIGKILDLFNIENNFPKRWNGL
ncbi:MAG: UbiX family flavin prenyltransferase [Alphaproteobacteria bacterium]